MNTFVGFKKQNKITQKPASQIQSKYTFQSNSLFQTRQKNQTIDQFVSKVKSQVKKQSTIQQSSQYDSTIHTWHWKQQHSPFEQTKKQKMFSDSDIQSSPKKEVQTKQKSKEQQYTKLTVSIDDLEEFENKCRQQSQYQKSQVQQVQQIQQEKDNKKKYNQITLEQLQMLDEMNESKIEEEQKQTTLYDIQKSLKQQQQSINNLKNVIQKLKLIARRKFKQ